MTLAVRVPWRDNIALLIMRQNQTLFHQSGEHPTTIQRSYGKFFGIVKFNWKIFYLRTSLWNELILFTENTKFNLTESTKWYQIPFLFLDALSGFYYSLFVDIFLILNIKLRLIWNFLMLWWWNSRIILCNLQFACQRWIYAIIIYQHKMLGASYNG